jgi:hypothetical protein
MSSNRWLEIATRCVTIRSISTESYRIARYTTSVRPHAPSPQQRLVEGQRGVEHDAAVVAIDFDHDRAEALCARVESQIERRRFVRECRHR